MKKPPSITSEILSAVLLGLGLSFAGAGSAAADPVPLPCEPNCEIDPCDLAPERCNPPGGGPYIPPGGDDEPIEQPVEPDEPEEPENPMEPDRPVEPDEPV